MRNTYIEDIKIRRSIYSLGTNINISDDLIVDTIKQAVKYSPSAFNSQSSRLVILFGLQSKKLWEIVKTELKKIVPVENFAKTEAKINSFAIGYGTILYFEDNQVIEDLQKKFPSYAHNFTTWSEQHSGMVQSSVWSALAILKIGASLQHYNELIELKVKNIYNLPNSWVLKSQMPFGSIEKYPDEKQFMNLDMRLKVFK